MNISTEYIPKTAPQARKNATPRRRQQQPDDDDDDNNGGGNGGGGNLQDFFNRFFGGPGGPQFQFGEPELIYHWHAPASQVSTP